MVFACDSLQTDLSGFHLRESNDLDKKVEELKASGRSILNDTRDDFLRLKPRPLWPIQPKGLCLGVLIGALAFFKWGVAGQLLMACLFGSLGMAVERFVRRREIKKAERIRTHEFRAKVLERLGLAEGESAV